MNVTDLAAEGANKARSECAVSHLVLGGARSGKSAFAEKQMQNWLQQHPGGCVYYLATAPRSYQIDDSLEPKEDSEMLKRIKHHQQQRPNDWLTLEESIFLADQLQQLQSQIASANSHLSRNAPSAVLLDCLTLWMLNIIEANCREQEVKKLLDFLEQTQVPIIMVSNEIGLGVVPMGKLSREFVDELGRLHQEVAKRVERVTFVTAGLPMQLKG